MVVKVHQFCMVMLTFKCVSAVPPVSAAGLGDGLESVSQFFQLCGNLSAGGWTIGCSQLELCGCALREVSVSIQRDREAQEMPISCRVGEILLMDGASLQTPPHLVQGLCIYDVVWLRGAGTSTSPCLHLNATMHWDYPPELVRHFRVYWRRIPPGQLALMGRAYSNLYRVTELEVPEAPGLLELVVEPVIRKGFPLPESHWGRRSLSYTEAKTK
ncbi:cytosolic endo-beta-N-acetylglucosaminidase-like [Notothenia coriiceps]|uniref:Cytosolic endo-beta-N-acetylglucosaminidase-like n=1 Tax=Notothenia coriiceps TaxID=8208 RepID=A0A6I9P521_9TELE|nr:PREDICTED: cytosolic endo-beta-N-acetylglucosaminidase-like [Notothenia coriiceps]